MKLKASLHLHTNDDPADSGKIEYSFKEAVDFLSDSGFKVISLTCHHKVVYLDDYIQYAASRGILLIPGVEIDVLGKYVLILNAHYDTERVKTFNDLRDYKKNHIDSLIVAAHPFAPHPWLKSKCVLGKDLENNIDIFDAIEWTWYYSRFVNSNLKSQEIAEKYNLPLIATSDIHFFDFADNCFCVIDAEEKTIPAIIDAIRHKNFQNVCSPVRFFRDMIIRELLFIFKNKIKK